MQKKIHQGHNIKRFREMLGIKQDALAADLGDDWNQQKISLLEQKETIDAPLLQQVAEALKLPVEAIKNFDEDQAINIISNTVNNNDNANGNTLFSYYPTINPIEKWLEALEENKKLYERMIKEKDDMIYTLQAMLENMKK
ncbi:transcriptional regulator [Niabella ginsenosidivorans]|uniref:Transcriptional regulator n=2 Tax=Niabella ginsenosidivorans TaxID=1176587 RepID=A0A1A9I8T5_9BACT|nr:transcriptional regulator [Niabella ginsenosidivorans]